MIKSHMGASGLELPTDGRYSVQGIEESPSSPCVPAPLCEYPLSGKSTLAMFEILARTDTGNTPEGAGKV